VLGYLTQRLGLSPIVGYLLAGTLVGPHTPGFVANSALAEELAIGIVSSPDAHAAVVPRSPASVATVSRCSCIKRRPRKSRDRTVPIGTPNVSAADS